MLHEVSFLTECRIKVCFVITKTVFLNVIMNWHCLSSVFTAYVLSVGKIYGSVF